jgi:ribosome-associated heat shock protein Hsp15
MRLDRWLWCARFFKTRSLAAEAIKGGHIKADGKRVKAAKQITVGCELSIAKGSESWMVTVTALAQRRGSASLAQTLYDEDVGSQARRLYQRLQRKVSVGPAPTPGRPDKRTRRLIRERRGRVSPR